MRSFISFTKGIEVASKTKIHLIIFWYFLFNSNTQTLEMLKDCQLVVLLAYLDKYTFSWKQSGLYFLFLKNSKISNAISKTQAVVKRPVNKR